jgi:hypothetical protein
MQVALIPTLQAALQATQAAHASRLISKYDFCIDFEYHPKPAGPCDCFVHKHENNFPGYVDPFMPFVLRDSDGRPGVLEASYRPSWVTWCDDFLGEYTAAQGQLLESSAILEAAERAKLLHPIDLKTIADKVRNWRAMQPSANTGLWYTHPAQFANDIRLLVRNTMVSTCRFSEEFDAAMSLAEMFELQWCNLAPPPRETLTRFPQQNQPGYTIDFQMLCAMAAPELVLWCTPLMLAEELVAIATATGGSVRVEEFGIPPTPDPRDRLVRQISEAPQRTRKRGRRQVRDEISVTSVADGEHMEDRIPLVIPAGNTLQLSHTGPLQQQLLG